MMLEKPTDTRLWKQIENSVVINTEEGLPVSLTANISFCYNHFIYDPKKVMEDPSILNWYAQQLASNVYWRILEMAGITENDIAEANLCVKLVKGELV